MDLSDFNVEYQTSGLSDLDLGPDPVVQFERWFIDAEEAGLVEPNAMVLATVDADGQPWTRHILLKKVTPKGFDFFTNYKSSKSQHLKDHPKASLTFGWLGQHRQVHVAGTVSKLSKSESDEYWKKRGRDSQIASWASEQSALLSSRQSYINMVEDISQKYPDNVPRPDTWGGWRVTPHTIEFWQGRKSRMHDRFRYFKDLNNSSWGRFRLYP